MPQNTAFNISFLPRKLSLTCLPGESIYDAALRQRVSFPVSCRNGNCLRCKGKMVKGECLDAYNNKKVHAGSVNTDILLCKAFPQSDCDIEIEGVLGPGELPLQTISCQVESIEVLPASVYRVLLRLPAGKSIQYYAGQYLAIQIPGKEPSFFSIASAPGSRLIELHIQALEGWTSAEVVIDWLKQHQSAKVELPHGRACITEEVTSTLAQRTAVLMAAGTGFSQMKSIVEQLINSHHQQPIHLFWGVRQHADMYLRETAEDWERKYANLYFHPVIAEGQDSEWLGHHEELLKAVVDSDIDVKKAEFFISGSPDMVYAAVQGLTTIGATATQFHSDVFEYAPRCMK